MTHFYVFSHFIHRIPVYDRTCGTERAAADRVKQYRTAGRDAFYCTTLPKHHWY